MCQKQVTVITNFPTQEKIPNYKEILLDQFSNVWERNRFDFNEMSVRNMQDILYTIGLNATEHALNNIEVQSLINSNDIKYDLMIVEQFNQEAFLMLGHKLNIPIVSIATLGYGIASSGFMGFMTPWSHVPHEFLPYDDRMTFLERLNNVKVNLIEMMIRKYSYLPKQDELVKKYFKNLEGPLPTISQLERNISLLLVNSHVALSTPRPSIMGVVSIGGSHIKGPKNLIWDVRQFIEDSPYGVIFFSLGTNIKSSDLPIEKIEIFLKVFSGLKQKVIWKFENDKIPNLPKNVMIKKWVEQNDLLAHPHVRVFITHGGILSIQEGIHRSVPMLGIPVYGEQNLNMHKASQAGYAITLNYNNITEASLSWALNELLYNPSYSTKVLQLSKIFRDRPIRALEETMYWIEYVIRHKGAYHMQSSAIEISWFKYFLLDIFGFVFLVVIIGFAIIYGICKYFLYQKNKRKGFKKIN